MGTNILVISPKSTLGPEGDRLKSPQGHRWSENRFKLESYPEAKRLSRGGDQKINFAGASFLQDDGTRKIISSTHEYRAVLITYHYGHDAGALAGRAC